MSTSDADVEAAVQPDEGQGEQAQSDAPWAQYLEGIPDEAREPVEEAFRKWDSDTTKKFQDASEYRNGWKPFEELGVNQRDPEEVKWALDMLEAAKTNPHGVAEWYQGYAQQHGLSPAEQKAQEEEQWVDPTVQSAVDQRMQEQLGPMSQQLGQLTEWQQQQQQAYQQQQAMAQVQQAWNDVKQKAGDDFVDSRVEMFLGNHLDKTDPRQAIEAALNDWVSVRNQIEKDALQGKADTPPGAESGGSPDGSPEPVNSLQRASELALEQLRGNNRS